MGFIHTAFAKLYGQDLPFETDEIFESQKEFLSHLVKDYDASPLYQILGIKQEQIKDLNAVWLKNYLAHGAIVDYQKHIYPLVKDERGITAEKADLSIKTSGTSDAYKWGKLIPAQWSSLELEREAIQRTLAYYIWEHPDSKVFLPYSFALTAPFDDTTNIGYVSWSLRKANKLVEWTMFPSQEVLSIANNQAKREAIVEELLNHKLNTPYLRSIHGVPAWPLAIIDLLIQRDAAQATKILSKLEYISIGGGSPGDYKQQFQSRLDQLGLTQTLGASNNHNASEWFFGAQARHFSDLEYQRMVPLYKTNFFLFVPEAIYHSRKDQDLSDAEMIQASHLLHEIQGDEVYFMLFANDRIPWLYDIKDKVQFRLQAQDDPLEYQVIGRYSMSSNLINEHIESDILQQVLQELSQEYVISTEHFVAGLELDPSKTSAVFHMILEGDRILSWEQISDLTAKFDALLGEHNTQWKFFRENNTRITDCKIYLQDRWFIREAMIQSGIGHEQSKIPLLSDHNYEAVVQPLLAYAQKHQLL